MAIVRSCNPDILNPQMLLSFRIHRRRHRHAGPQQVLGILARLEHDLHRHALHDLDEVAGGVLRRQQAEARAGGARRCCRRGP